MPRRAITLKSLPRTVHCLGICGRLVGGLALALQDAGVRVSGTDERQFPPMPDLLAKAGIQVAARWTAKNLPHKVDAVVAGGLVDGKNPELAAARRRGVPVLNAASFLEHYILRRTRNLVVAGTKGKTTTTAMLAWILRKAGKDALHLIGGQIRGADWPLLRLQGGPIAVLEGDEFPSGAEDPVPKFHRYHAHQLIVTNVSHDHPDIFPTAESYAAVFQTACERLLKDGQLVLNADDRGAMELATSSPASVVTAGFSARASRRITAFCDTQSGCRFRLAGTPFALPICGRMNARNAALAAAAAEMQGISPNAAAAALADFPGITGRQELLARIGRSHIYFDDSCHPIALGPLLQSLRVRHRGRRLIVILVPCNTGGRQGICQRELPAALQPAFAVLAFPGFDSKPPEGGPFDDEKFRRDLKRQGILAKSPKSLPEMLAQLEKLVRDGDTVLISLTPGPPTATRRIVDCVAAAITRTPG